MLTVEPILARLPRQHRQRHHAAHHVQRVNHHQRERNAVGTPGGGRVAAPAPSYKQMAGARRVRRLLRYLRPPIVRLGE